MRVSAKRFDQALPARIRKMLGNLQAQHDIEAASEEKGRAKVDFANQFSGDLKLFSDDDDSI